MHPAFVSAILRRPRSGCVTPRIALALLLAAAGCRSSTGSPAGSTRVLFVGNSLTGTNDLPRMFAAVAAAGGLGVTTGKVVFANVSLNDHLARGDAVDAIESGDWDYVVLQQGPSGLPSSRVELIAATRDFAAAITAAGARPALYMVWPDASRLTAFDSVSMSYTQAADAVDGLLAPSGDAWVNAWQRKPSLPLYGDDGFHPSPLGSYLAALAIYAVVCDRSPAMLPARPVGVNALLLRGVSDDDLRILHDAATAVTASLSRKGACDAQGGSLRVGSDARAP